MLRKWSRHDPCGRTIQHNRPHFAVQDDAEGGVQPVRRAGVMSWSPVADLIVGDDASGRSTSEML